MSEKALKRSSFWGLSEVKVFLISLAHGINDTYAGFLPTFIPHIKQTLGLSYALAGSFNVVVGIFHIVFQPIIGYLCDRIRRPWLMIVGPVLCGLGAVLIPNTSSYGAAIFFAGIWGLGSALYHPQGSGGIGYVSKPDTLTRDLTWFNIGGTVGSMISPLIAVFVIRTLGYRGLWVTLIPALLLAPLLYFSMPFLRDEPAAGEEKSRGFFKTIGTLFAVLYPIWAVSLIRDLVFQCVRFFLPLRIAAEGGSLEHVGTAIFCITLGGTLAMFPTGILAKRFGSKRVLRDAMLVAACILTAAAFVPAWAAVALYLLGVSCIYSTLPLTVSMAQRLVPNERSAASSIVMGLAWGFSNILVSPFGKVADLVGVETALLAVGFLPLLGMPFFLTKPFRELNEA